MTQIYVIGHINPDTDSIASAIGYAWYLRESEGVDAVAARAGALNPQTAWVLKKLSIDLPLLLNDASPRFEAVTRRLDSVTPESPLRDAWAIASRTWGVAPVIEEDGTPFGLITGSSLFAYLSQALGPHPRMQETPLSEILAHPCKDVCDTDVPKFKVYSRIRDALNQILREDRDDFWVIEKSGEYVGICRQRDVLNPPRLKVVLVDHNEPSQALAHLEDAEIVEILDHHRLGNPSTHTPIRFKVDRVGSTSTLISEQIEKAGLSAPPEIAGLLLAGLLSDTLILSSPTTTDRDTNAADRLGRWAFIKNSPLAGEKVTSYGEQIVSAGAGLASREPDEIVRSDLKQYDSGNFKFAIAQAEVTDLVQLTEHLDQLKDALSTLRDKHALDFAMLMVTDVVRGSTRLIISHEPPELSDLPYPKQPDGTRRAKGVVSRKIQLLPVVLGLLER